mmetsp:Transcript_1784/g.4093  ORF Transcript_1784/g.4093 Transcript_1784/m.4093 type:complete len:295 (+) Transcript_1784:109-993(+)
MDDDDEVAVFYDFQVIFVPGLECLEEKLDQDDSVRGANARGQAPEPSEAHIAVGSQVSSMAAANCTEPGGRSQGGPRKRPRTDIAADQHAKAASLPGAVIVPASKVLLSLHSGVLRPILAACKDQATLVVPCDDPEHVQAGRLTMEMILDLARPSHLRKHDALFHSLPPAQLIKCVRFAVYWDAQSCVEHCIDCLTTMDPTRLSIQDAEALLDLPGAVQVMEGQQRKVKDVCKKKLMQEFRNVSQVLADDALTHRLCSLSSSALALLCQCDLGSRGSRPCYLALWFSRAQGVTC